MLEFRYFLLPRERSAVTRDFFTTFKRWHERDKKYSSRRQYKEHLRANALWVLRMSRACDRRGD